MAEFFGILILLFVPIQIIKMHLSKCKKSFAINNKYISIEIFISIW